MSHVLRTTKESMTGSSTSGEAVLRPKLIDGRCHVQSLVAVVDLAIRSFLRFSPKLT